MFTSSYQFLSVTPSSRFPAIRSVPSTVPPSNDGWAEVITNYCTRYAVHQAANVLCPGNDEELSRTSVLNFNTNTYLAWTVRVIVYVRCIWSSNRRWFKSGCRWEPATYQSGNAKGALSCYERWNVRTLTLAASLAIGVEGYGVSIP